METPAQSGSRTLAEAGFGREGDLRGYWSSTISGRIVFRFADGDRFDVDLVDYH